MAKLLTGLLVFCVCFAAGIFVWIYPFLYPGPGESIERWETERGGLKIVVTAYTEYKSLLPGAYYFFEAIDQSNTKREIMNFRHDDPVPIQKDGIVFVNDDVAYVFMGWKYAVTTDAGQSWQVVSIDKDLPDLKCCNYGLIQEVSVSADGTGRMKLRRHPIQQNSVTELFTKDFGRHWSTQ